MDRARIRRIRSELGLSQERFAHLLGVSVQSVRRWEGGLVRPLPVIAAKLEDIARDLASAQRSERGGGMGDGEHDQRRQAFGFGGMFKGMGNLVDLVSRMAEEGQDEVSRAGSFEAHGGEVKGVYGLSVRLGLGGNPVVEEFGNLRSTASGPAVSDSREPLVDVLDEVEQIVVIVEVPGVEERDIHTDVRGSVLTISAATGRRKYSKEVALPAAVDPASVAISYLNGVLEVRLAKRSAPGVRDG